MSSTKKRPLSITLAAAVVICIITFILGFVLSSFAFLDSRLEAANENAAELNAVISEKNAEIKELEQIIEQKNENNITLGEQIQSQLSTIESLNGEIASLKSDVDYISEAAINGTLSDGSTFFFSFSSLTLSQQLIILVVLLVIIIFIVSITCGIIASKTSDKSKRTKKSKTKDSSESTTETQEPSKQDEPENEVVEDEPEEPADDFDFTASEPEHKDQTATLIPQVERAIDLLYHNKLEDSISDLKGFKFGITNFDEILSDKRRPKSFGNSDNGDFVAFMSSDESTKKLYIIPRNMILSDSTVALRGITDLFNVVNESGTEITHGTVKIKEISAPAVFSCGEDGWSIESKGSIIALGTHTM